MSDSSPIIIFDDHILFHTRYTIDRGESTCVDNYDPDYFITPFGYFVPETIHNFNLLDYLKSPTEEGFQAIESFKNMFYVITPLGKLYHVTMSKESGCKFFCSIVPSGKGVRTIINSDNNAKYAMCLNVASDYEDFIRLVNGTTDPNQYTQRAKITDIGERLKKLGGALNIANCSHTFTAGNIS